MTAIADAPLVFSNGHRCFAGHFPDNPIVPAVTLLSELIERVERRIGKVVVGISNARFSSVVRPDTVLSVLIEPKPSTGDVIRVSCRDGERIVVHASFLVADV